MARWITDATNMNLGKLLVDEGVLSAQSFYKPTTALKVYIKKNPKVY